MPPVMALIKPSSGMCNMSCDYCFYCDEMEKRKQSSYGFMSEDTIKNVIRRTLTVADGMASYAFQGGEPTLRGLDFFRRVMELEKQYNRKGIRVTNAIQTNGYAINEEWCQFFHDNHFLVGLSVDGTREIHNSLRHDRKAVNGPCDEKAGSSSCGEKAAGGTYDRVLAAAELMDRYQVDYNILTVVSDPLAGHIREIYEDYRKRGWHYQQYIACLDPLGEERGKNPWAITPEKYGQFLIDLFELWYRDWKKGQAPYIRQFENYVGILMGYPPESCEQRGICTLSNVVEADGSVYPCDFYMLDEYRLGNFNENRLCEILEKGRKTGFTARSMKLSEDCKACKYFRLCRGGCQRNRIFREGDGSYENYFCKSYRMFFDRWADALEKIAAAALRQ